MSIELIGAYPLDDDELDDAVAGEEYDDEEAYALAGDLEIIGYEDELDDDAIAGGFLDDELDAIAGLEEDLDVLAGYDDDGSEVARLLEATAGLAPRRRPVRRAVRRAPARRPAPARRVAARRVARTVNNLGRRLQAERSRTAKAMAALRRARAAPRPAPRPPQRVIPAAGGGQRQLVQRQPTTSGVEPIGVNSEGTIPAGQTRQITVRPQVLFRPNKYHISEAVGQNFLINNITIGKHSQFGTSGSLPGTTFSDENLRFAWKTCQPGQDITVTVTNITSADHSFLSTLWGDSVE